MAKAGRQEAVEGGTVTLQMNNRAANADSKFPSNYIRTTKYTLYDFLPMNLFEQFHKMSNIFFLINMCIALVPGASPVFPATTILPLVVVVSVAAGRDAYEDYQRYQSDKRANGLPVKMVDASGKVVEIPSKDVQVGDVLYLERGAEIPADAVVISTALEDGACFVETANLDGETNKKPKQSRNPFHTKFRTPQSIVGLSGTVQCDAPNNSLHKWQGTVSVPDIPPQSCDIDNFLLRGCIASNCDWVMACVCFTGVKTKLFLNLTQKPPKISRLDTKLNRLIIAILAVQQSIILMICGLRMYFQNSPAAQGFYIRELLSTDSGAYAFFFAYMSYFILLSLMMPISLFVSLEFCKTAQAKLMEWDDAMTSKEGRCKARTSSLNEELSQVQYIFSDKTGTLTENLMRFALAYAGGTTFDELKKPGEMQRFMRQHRGATAANEVDKFLRLLILCNNVVINVTPSNEIKYDGSSTDEIALVDCAVSNGYRLLGRTSDTMTVSINSETAVHEVLTMLPFTSERKMMSMVIREKDGTIRMLTKGADSAVLSRLDQSDRVAVAGAQAFLDKCAGDGLRTLACGERVFSVGEYSEWKKTWDAACLTVSADRNDKVHKAALEGERGLRFIGCTAIEDKLQDEVPETIHFLLRCGIVVWVLTGDKRETAVNIAGTSRLLDPKNDLVIHLDLATGVPALVQIDEATRRVNDARSVGRKCSFIVDGASLETILLEPTFEKFRQLGLLVNSAVCCRVTPLQKASVVAMFQELGSTCIGIGDGANDVSMIQEARVGIGIIGLEGSQAERASDYAIPRFRHLRRLLAVHGRYSLIRNSHLVQYSFYKNLVYTFTQVYYSFYTGYSGQTIYDSWVITFLNMAFTLFPPLVMGMVDYDIRDSFLLKHPGLYSELRSPFAVRMSRVSSWMWFLLALFQSWVIFYGTFAGLLTPDEVSYRSGGMWASGTSLMNLLLCVVTFQSLMSFLSLTFLHAAALAFSIIAYVLFVFAYAAVPPSWGVGGYFGVPLVVFGDVKMWLNMLLWMGTIFGPEVAAQVLRRSYFGTNMHRARKAENVIKKSLPWEDAAPLSPRVEPLLSHQQEMERI